MTRQDLGAPPSGPKDVTTVEWVYATYPSYSLTVSTSSNYTVVLPDDPVDHTMFLLEVDAGARIIVTVPDTVVLTEGLSWTTMLPSGAIGFFGFRYSASAAAWFLLSATNQNFGGGGGGGGEGPTPVIGEVPGGLINGTNAVFTTLQTFQVDTTSVYTNGLREQINIDYVESLPDQIVFTNPPGPNDKVTVDYLLPS